MFFKRVLGLVGGGQSSSYLISGIGLAGLTAAGLTTAGDGTDTKSKLELARNAGSGSIICISRLQDLRSPTSTG